MAKFNILIILLFSLLMVNVAFAQNSNDTEIINIDYSDLDQNLSSDVDVAESGEGDDFDSVQHLLDNLNSGDSVYLENETYYGNGTPIHIKKDVTIYGSESGGTVLDANHKSNIFIVYRTASLTLVNLTLTNGYSDSTAGTIKNAGKLTIINSTMTNSIADRGGIYCSNFADLTIHNSYFASNSAISGAAIESEAANGVMKIVNTTFEKNKCEEGGAIYNIFCQCSIYNSTFTNNSAQRGGAIYNNRGILKVYNSKVVSNFCDDLGAGIKSWGICEVHDSIIANNTNTVKQGGGFYVSEFSLLIENCIVENNTAVWGGGVYVEAQAELNVINSKINNNSAERGGGIDLNQGMLKLTNSTVSNNVAELDGGAIRCGFLPSYIENAIIENNVAKNGGGVYVDGVAVSIVNSILNNNSADTGGAFYNGGDLSLKNVNVTSSSADNGGAIYNKKYLTINDVIANNNRASQNGAVIYNVADVDVHGLTANNNRASQNGGVIYNVADLDVSGLTANRNEAYFGGVIYTNHAANINNSILNYNKASGAGAIYSTNDLIIHNSQFKGNQITRKGGALALYGGIVDISNSVFSFNTGADEGGCIFNDYAELNIRNSQFISNKAKSYGAAIDNGGTLTIENSLFDNNQAYGAGSIDNGGTLTIINSNFTNNMATKNGGAIDNNGNMEALGCIFENNIAEGDGGAIMARRSTSISHSIIINNKDSNGFAIFNDTFDTISVSDNWWGSNNPDFDKLLNFNLSDDFKWIIMNFKNSTKLIREKNSGIVISFDEVINKNGSVSKLQSADSFPIFKVKLSTGNVFDVVNGSLSKVMLLPSIAILTAQKDNESISLDVALNPDKIKRIINNKNVVVDYPSKATFKVRVIGDDGKPVGKGVAIVMKIGKKSYKATTDKNGYASRTFAFIPGKYTVISSYKGYSVKNTITVKNVLKAKSITKKKAKKIYYYASLKTSNGKAIAGKKVSFTVKGITYKAFTSKKGIAIVCFKNLNVGKYLIMVKYLKSQVKVTLKVKK